MDIFLALIFNIFPLYCLIALGFLGGRYFEIETKTLANLAIFIIVPIVMFGFVLQLDVQSSYLLIPVAGYAVQCVVAFFALYVGQKIYSDTRANLLAMCSSYGNAGYLGLPIVILLFDAPHVAIYMLLMVAGFMFEATVSYYIAARGHFSIKDSLMRVVKFPALHAVLIGLFMNSQSWEMPDIFFTYWEYFKGAFVVVGMMIIGAALGKTSRLVFSVRFTSLVFVGKFLVFPAVMYGVVLLDLHMFGFFSNTIHEIVLVFSLMPPAANITAYAAQLNLKPEKAASIILFATVFALFYIPAMLVIIGI